MKTSFTIPVALLFLTSFPGFSQRSVSPPLLPGNVSKEWYTHASDHAMQMEYDFYRQGNAFRVTNAANRMRFEIDKTGYKLFSLQYKGSPESWMTEMTLVGIRRNEMALHFSSEAVAEKADRALIYRFGFADVEYINNAQGLRQNFHIYYKLPGDSKLKVDIQLSSTLAAWLDGDKLIFHPRGNVSAVRFMYEDLHVWDATGKKLDACMELDKERNMLSIVVNDHEAVYPITVDPLNRSSEWQTSADGILPGLLNDPSLQVHTMYGFAVTNLGDINGDNYDDVAIGAPGMANVVTGNGTLLGVGAVFIYMGSSSGLSTVPAKVLQPDTAAAGACFGFSIEAGNISADGLNDIVVGAPLDSYQTTLSGLLGNVNVNVNAGKVYYFRSEDLLASSNPAPFVQIRLQGDDFFGAGILGLLDNTGTKSLFGFSLGITDDLNGDNRQDLVIGCPAYLGKDLLSVQRGAAFVYYSDDLATATPVQLSVPTPSILGLISLPLANLSGLLFGYSVDGIGDYNNDGNPDVVVSAPAGMDLSSLGGIFTGQVLGGSAYVYYGNGSGINTAIGATLQPSAAGLLSNAANLFGYKVKGLENGLGAKNGNIMIGAATGSVLSNIAGGLQLKAGQVHVFKKKTTAFSSPVNSDQVLNSPRSSSLLSVLSGQSLDVSALYGASMDNMGDANCDGIGDIVIGEPLSANVPIAGANVTGGAAYVHLGLPDGTYQATPSWSLFPEVSPLLGVNATSLVGYSVAGGVRTHGAAGMPRAIIGGPSNSLDFGSGLLNLGNTAGTLLDFIFDNNGLGKTYSFLTGFCGITLPLTLIDFSGGLQEKTIQLTWKSANEINVDRYELQRSANGAHFETIALVFAKNEHENNYAYKDAHPYKGTNYYRLKIFDVDGGIDYSEVISFRFNEALPGTMTIAPNPVKELVRARLTGIEHGSYEMKLFSMDGRVLAAKKIIVSRHDQAEIIGRSAVMRPGTYSLNLYNGKGVLMKTAILVITD